MSEGPCEKHRVYAEEVTEVIQDYIWKVLTPTQGQREDLEDMFADLRIALSEIACHDWQEGQ
jgi:hypothetical protein